MEELKRSMLVFCIVAAIFLLLAVFGTGLNRAVVWYASQSDIHDCNNEININKKYDCLLVLGASVRPDGSPSPILEDRLRGAVALYKAGVSDIVLLSGDDSGDDYDEVECMERYCLENGVLPLPKSTNAARIAANADVFDFAISAEDMQTLINFPELGFSGYSPEDGPADALAAALAEQE